MYQVKSADDFLGLYDIYYRKIYNFFIRNISQIEDAEDQTSQTFINALQYIKKKKPVIENFNAWIYKIATNQLYAYLKKRKRKKNLTAEQPDPAYIDALEGMKSDGYDHADYMAAMEAVKSLGDDDRLMIEMHFFENLSYREMSEILNIKEVTLRSRIHRCLGKLSSLFREGTE